MRPESTAEPTPAEGTHNHLPSCCCPWQAEVNAGHVTTPMHQERCPACPEHGGQSDECPSCHTHAGHPHTDYCQNIAPAEYPGQPDHCTYDPLAHTSEARGTDLYHAGGPARVPYPHSRSRCTRPWCGLDPNPYAP